MDVIRGTGRWAALRGWLLVVALLGVLAVVLTSRAHAAPTAGLEEGPRQGGALGSPDPAGSSPATTYLNLQADGRTPVTWSPCRPIHYVMRPDRMPPGGQRLLEDAIAQVSALSGLRFVYDGPTDEYVDNEGRQPYQRARYGDRWAPVLVVWGNPSSEGGYVGGVPLAGWAGPFPEKAGDGSQVYVSGWMDLDADWTAAWISKGGEQYVRAMMLHELGHLIGLDHTAAQGMLMNVTGSGGGLTFSPDELRGIESLGAGPCHRDI
ncbi:MAG: matrixin family metalloprotease [Candidatus Nanopelagicales bacterium]